LSFSKLVEPGCFFPKLVEPTCELCEWVVSKPLAGVRGVVVGFWLPGVGWFRLSRSLALTCWLNQLSLPHAGWADLRAGRVETMV